MVRIHNCMNVASNVRSSLSASNRRVPTVQYVYTTKLSCTRSGKTTEATLHQCSVQRGLPLASHQMAKVQVEKLLTLKPQRSFQSRQMGFRSRLAVRSMHQTHDVFYEVDDDQKMLTSFDLVGVADKILLGGAKNIVVMLGAGASVSAGIPDFRSPGSGLYDNLQKYNLPYPEAVFDLEYFREKPQAFNTLAKELYPGETRPTATHYWVRLLEEKGLLLRCFTQNIDSLETQAGVSPEKLVAAHGNFDKAHCIDCNTEANSCEVRETLFTGSTPRCSSCGGLVKPDIVFFGERLPSRFRKCADADMPECDLLVVIGTSLQVFPFAGLVGEVSDTTPRLLVNREMVGQHDPFVGTGFFNFGLANTRDAAFLGDCDDGIWELVDLLGWRPEMEILMKDANDTCVIDTFDEL